MKRKHAFTLLELLIVVAIIALLAAIILASLGGARARARDSVRKGEISQIGHFFALSCYLPNAGGGDYDLGDLYPELRQKYPQFDQTIKTLPKDPRLGTDQQTYYRYIVTNDATNCAVYANFENDKETVTLPSISTPTPGGGKGVFAESQPGWNGSTKFFQDSN